MEITSPYKVLKVIFKRNYPGYVYRRELVDDSEQGGDGKLPMVNCYSSNTGHWIGDAKTARYLCIKRGLVNVQKAKRTHCAASIGFDAVKGKWYGWSHRAIFGFGMGDILFEQRYGNLDTKFSKHGKKRIKTLTEAKLAAKRFASYVS